MRLDKFLKVARLAKRRTEAKEALDAGRIELCETTGQRRSLKPGYQVKPNDELLIHFATRDVRVRVLVVPEKVGPKMKDQRLYAMLSDTKTA